MSATFTPGPWVICEDRRGFQYIESRPDDATPDLVAYVFGENAGLIRAAPELAETLKLLLTRVLMEKRTGKLPPEWGCPIITDALAVLASVDTHAKRGDATQIAAPSPMSGAVPKADAQKGQSND